MFSTNGPDWTLGLTTEKGMIELLDITYKTLLG